MENERKLIYSMRNPTLDDFIEPEETPAPQTPEAEAKMKADLERIYYCLEHESEYKPIPGREEGKHHVIRNAQGLGELGGVDLDVWEEKYCIRVRIYLEMTMHGKMELFFLGRLFAQCDRFSLSTREVEKDIMIDLEYDTHEFLVSGRRINC